MSIPNKTDQVRSEWLAINKLNPKEKYKRLKALSFQLDLSEDLTIEDIELYTTIINSAKKIAGFPSQLNKKLQQLSYLKLKLLGIDLSELKIVLKENFFIDLEAAAIGIADEAFLKYGLEQDQEKIKQVICQGQRLCFSTGCDGTFKVQVRMVNLEYPVFSEKEQKTLIAYSDILTLEVPTGTLVITDYLSEIPEKIIKVLPGQYRVCFNLNKQDTYIICLAKISSRNSCIKNDTEIPVIEG
ncbi:hypothetical protein [Legionella hackeliae]|uniref:Uncharacterized protein n=1 Tax=Legionella hackeliae TaxID=449 RepID=A0A0A8UVF5_LEGHA|nr:hypothetical protein [Legionella hackeliae]KTD13196.1 hypothetical protein Lhac_1065 [Legionella hackeliae]CEK11491.1 conserved protein of unknown function [Legionella hackeliae]STX48259.1 Uncharacterised protein [Legionella hackeliae]